MEPPLPKTVMELEVVQTRFTRFLLQKISHVDWLSSRSKLRRLDLSVVTWQNSNPYCVAHISSDSVPLSSVETNYTAFLREIDFLSELDGFLSCLGLTGLSFFGSCSISGQSGQMCPFFPQWRQVDFYFQSYFFLSTDTVCEKATPVDSGIWCFGVQLLYSFSNWYDFTMSWG